MKTKVLLGALAWVALAACGRTNLGFGEACGDGFGTCREDLICSSQVMPCNGDGRCTGTCLTRCDTTHLFCPSGCRCEGTSPNTVCASEATGSTNCPR